MGFLNLLFPFIDQFTTGKFIRRFFSILYQVFGWTFFVIGVVAMLGGIYTAINSDQGIIIFGAIVCMPIVAAGGYLLMQISLYKADSISKMDESDYTAIPIVSLFIRYLGELFLAVLAIQGLFFLLASLFVSDFGIGLAYFLRGYTIPLPDSLIIGNELLDGLMNLFDIRRNRVNDRSILFLIQTVSYIFSLINGVLVMLFFYFIAEISLVLADIAANTRRLLSRPESSVGSSIKEENKGQCTNCGFQNERDDMFCTNCGRSLAK